MHQLQALQRLHRDIAHPLPLALFEPGAREYVSGEVVGQQIALPHFGPAFVGRAGNLIEPVGNTLAVNDRLVRRHRPWGRRPDNDMGTHEIPVLQCLSITAHRIDHLELHPDREAFLVMILDLRLGQRGLFHRRPHHGLGALIKRAVHQEFHELLGDHALGVKIHRQIGIVPVAGDPKPLELLALHIDP